MQAPLTPEQALDAQLRAAARQDGGRLPPERQLTASLGISRRALRALLARLELEGRIWRGVGQGTFLGPRPERAAPRAAARPGQPLVIMEARLTLEPALAALAAIKAGAEDIAAIARSARRGAETRDEAGWGQWDSAFHHGIARACHNPLLLEAFAQIEASRAQTDWGRLRGVIATAAMRRQAAREHQAIAAAIAGRDAAAAQQAMLRHLRSVHHAIQNQGAATAARAA